jgi:hypothetical protein
MQLDRPLPESGGRRVVRRDDRGRPVDDPAEFFHQPPDAGRVQAGGRLVQQPQSRAGPSQAPGHGQPAALPQAERSVEPGQRRTQAQRQRPHPGSESGYFEDLAGDALIDPRPAERDVLQDGRGQDGRMLRDPARRGRRALQAHPARRGRDEARHHPEQARLAGAARADQAHPLPGGHPQVDPVQHRQAPAFGREAHSLQEDAGDGGRGGLGDPLRDAEAAEPGQHGPAGGARVEIGRQPAHGEENLGEEDQHREGLREDPLASVQTQTEPDGHQGGADGGEEFEDQAGEQRDLQGGQSSRADLFARGGHGPLVVGGPAKGPEQRQAFHQRVEAVAEPLEAGQPAPDRGRGVRPDQPGQDRRDDQGDGGQGG